MMGILICMNCFVQSIESELNEIIIFILFKLIDRMIVNTVNRFSVIRCTDKYLMFANAFKFTRPRTIPDLFYNSLKFLRLNFSNRYYFSQNQSKLNSQSKTSNANLKTESLKSSFNPSPSVHQTILSRALHSFKKYMKKKIDNSSRALVERLANFMKRAAFLAFLIAMAYLGLSLSIGVLIVLASLYFIIREAINERQPTIKQISQRYKQLKNRLNKQIKVNRIIPTVNRAEQAVLNKIHEIQASKIKILLRTKGLIIGMQTMKNVKSSKGQNNRLKLYPFYLRKSIFH